jgi:hypothetical protein
MNPSPVKTPKVPEVGHKQAQTQTQTHTHTTNTALAHISPEDISSKTEFIFALYFMLHFLGSWFSAIQTAATCKTDKFWTKAIVTLLFGPAGLIVPCGE